MENISEFIALAPKKYNFQVYDPTEKKLWKRRKQKELKHLNPKNTKTHYVKMRLLEKSSI